MADFRKETDSQIDSLRYDAKKEIKIVKSDYRNDVEELVTTTNEALERIQTNFKEEIGIVKDDFETKFKQMGAKANMLLRESGWDETGEYIVGGLTRGVKRGTTDFLSAIKSTMEEAEAVANKTSKINSPSKVFTQIGSYLIQGLIVGVNSQKGEFLGTTEAVGTEAIGLMRDIVGKICAFADSDIDIQPAIRPVIDLSDMNSGMERLNGLFMADRSLSLGMSIGSTIQNSNKSLIEEMSARMEASNAKMHDKFSEAMNGVRGDIAELVDEVSRLQVVIDGDTLVGVITPKVDRGIGIKARMKRRGSM